MTFGRVVASLFFLLAAPAFASSFDYLHVEANEGDSSGGHVAVRFDDQVYHFQHRDGLVRLQRDSWKTFQHRYRTLGNRGIVALQIEISPSTHELLLRTFQRRYVVEEGEGHLLEILKDDVDVLESLVARGENGATVDIRVRGAGFFEPTSPSSQSADTKTLEVLCQRITARRGSSFLTERRQELKRQLAALRPTNPTVPPSASSRFPFVEPLFAQRLVALLSARKALDLLERPHRLRASQTIAPLDRPLRDEERRSLRAAADALHESLPRLIGGRRPDWGYAFLLGAARLIAMERSLEEDRWVVLSAMPSDADTIPLDASRRAALPDIIEEAKEDRETALGTALREEDFDEASWTEVESAFTRLAELRRGQRQGGILNVYPGAPLPAGEALVTLGSFGSSTSDQRTEALARARLRRSNYEASLRATHGYHLLLRNCVSEIFRTIDMAFADGDGRATDVAAVSRKRLGGYIDPVAGLNFIPFVSANHVRSSFSVIRESRLPSFRDYQIDRMADSEPRLVVALRESNVWTSTLYRPSREDGAFAFFTDRTVLLRPVLGAVNVAVGASKSVAGVPLAPVDGGRWLRSGLSGVVFSLPELLFVNLRKGSNDYVPPAMRPPALP